MTEKISGIYRIINTANGKQYIGSSVNVRERWTQHARLLRRGEHHSPYLQNAWDKYGEAAFEFELLWRVEPVREELLREEQQCFNRLPTEYNLAPVAASRLGSKVSAECRKRIGDTMRGVSKTSEHCDAIRRHARTRARARGRKIIGEKITTGERVTYDVMLDAKHDGFDPANIWKCCMGQYKQHRGYRWRYA